MDERMDRTFLLAISIGVAAGTAAALTSLAFPYALDAAYEAFQVRRRKEQREHRHRSKSDKVKRASSTKTREFQAYRDVLRQSLVNWKDIDISLDKFPYFLSENTRTALLDSMYIFLKRPEFTKYTTSLATVSPRILLTGPLGSEIYQESLVKALAHHLQVNMLTLDSTNVLLEVKDLQTGNTERVAEQLPDKHTSEKSTQATIHSSSAGNGKVAIDSQQLSQPSPQEGLAILNDGDKSKVLQKSVEAESVSQPNTRIQAENIESRPLALDIVAPVTSVESSKHQLKKGDRVKYVGPSGSSLSATSHRGSSGSKGPTVSSKGRVLLVLEDNPNKVGVRFDKPVYGGNNLVDLCEDGYGYFCNVSELRLEHSHVEDADKLILESLIDIVTSEASKEPLILFIKDIEKSIVGNIEHYRKLEQLNKTDARLVVIGSHTSDFQKEKGSSSAASSKSGNKLTALLELSFLDNLISRFEDLKGESPKASRMLVKLFPTRIYLQPPQDENLLLDWNQQLEHDTEILKSQTNRQHLRMVMGTANVVCNNLSSVNIKTHVLNHDMSEKVVGWAISQHLQKTPEPVLQNGKLVISSASLQHSLGELLSVQHSSSGKKSLKDVVCDNEFEKILLSEVIPPDELGVTFDHIGALDNVKEALRELVMLPLQRPELFSKGQLRKPCRGLLLFGPPGTGKTMLAKAVATEAGANFINISMATIASKWFGEAEKYVKAVFTLASKISPSVIFIDEVDSMLGRRGRDTEHSAMRKLKNEFMASWDGLRTRDKERVLVLGATNRPFDLDEAVIRRFPRRLMVDLPDAVNRAKILKVILADEDLASDLVIEELSVATEGYSGSDLKSLCTTAAYQRIREILDQEKKEKEKAKAAGVEPPPVGIPYIRPLTMADMKLAMEKVRSSVSADATSILELQQWNDQYGEGGTRTKPTLSYFM
eukprot:c28064_g2_i2 orf=544-3357(-)